MIERFNFYDVYAYLIPGFVLVALLWLPFGITVGAWPEADVASAVAALLLGYVVGHVLHTVSGRSIPVTRKGRFPSDMALMGQTKTLSPDVVAGVKRALRTRYGLDLQGLELETAQQDDVLRKRLRDAPRLCREDLIRERVGSYAEQFQGMYALMRGLVAASILSVFFYFGWLLANLILSRRSLLIDVVEVSGISLIVVSLLSAGLIALALRKSRRLLWILGLLLGFLGLVAGARLPLNSEHGFVLLVAIVALAVVGATSWVAFRRFTFLWADEVFRGFYALALERCWVRGQEEPREHKASDEPDKSTE